MVPSSVMQKYYKCLLVVVIMAAIMMKITSASDGFNYQRPTNADKPDRLRYNRRLVVYLDQNRNEVDMASDVPSLSLVTGGKHPSNGQVKIVGVVKRSTNDLAKPSIPLGVSRHGDYGRGKKKSAKNNNNWYIVVVIPRTESQLEEIYELLESEAPGIDFLREPNGTGDEVHILLSRSEYKKHRKRLAKTLGIKMLLKIDLKKRDYDLAPLQSTGDRFMPDTSLKRRTREIDLADMFDDEDGLSEELTPKEATKSPAGVTGAEEEIDIDKLKRETPPPNLDHLLVEPDEHRFLTFSELMQERELRKAEANKSLKGIYGLAKLDYQSDDYYKKHHHVTQNIERWMNLTRKYPQFIKYQTIAHSGESRPIYLFKIGFFMQNNPSSQNRPIILIDALHHGREWATLSSSSYFMEQILADMNNGILGHALKDFDYFVIPMINPDGYHFSIASDHTFWRKNRRFTSDMGEHGRCAGVDLKRNYPAAGFHKFEEHSHHESFSACSHYYASTMPLSEPETNALDSVMRKYGKQIKLYLNLNAYGKQLALPDDSNQMRKNSASVKGGPFIRALNDSPRKKSKRVLDFGPKTSGTYKVFSLKRKHVDLGNPVNHAFANHNIKLSYALYLPPHTIYNESGIVNKNWGFFLTSQEILPVAREFYLGVMAMVDTL